MSDNQTLGGFVRVESPGSYFCSLQNYTNGTAFFVSGVLESVGPDGDCTSSITLVPVPNDEGQYPVSFAPNGLFNITCITKSTNVPLLDRRRHWEYRVAGTLMLMHMHFTHLA
jgi:hypothetical protein